MDGKPNLPQLLNFGSSNVNIIEQIGARYHDFGTTLLRDGTGCIVDAIQKEERYNAADINRKVLTRWLKGQGRNPVSWATLATVLDECKLTEIAKTIRSEKGDRGLLTPHDC